MRLILRAAAAVTVQVIAVVAPVTDTVAAVGYHITTNQAVASLQASPSVTAPTVTTIPNGAAIDVECQIPGDRAGVAPYPTNATWDRVRYGNAVGYVTDMRVTTAGNGARENLANGGYFLGSVGLPRCGASAPIPSGPRIASGITAPLRGGPGSGFARAGSVAGGTGVTMNCWLDGAWETGRYATNRWFLVRAPDRWGFVHASFVDGQVGTPWCGGILERQENVYTTGARSAADAVAWALTQQGNRGYEGWCLRFTWHSYAYGLAVRGRGFQTPVQMIGTLPLNQGTPPRGSIVLYDQRSGRPEGHAAISLGNGLVVSSNVGGGVGVTAVDTFGGRRGFVPFSG